MTISDQTFLRTAILEIFRESLENEPIALEDLNKFVYLQNESEIIDRDIEWTWQHLIASSRKRLVDDSALTREKIGKTTYYTLSN